MFAVEPIIQALLGRSIQRLQFLCGTLLHRSYPRLDPAPLNLQTEEVLSAVVERLLKALRDLRPERAAILRDSQSTHPLGTRLTWPRP